MFPGGKESHDILKRISLGPEDEPRCAKLQSWQLTPCPLQMVLLEEKIMLTYNKMNFQKTLLIKRMGRVGT